MSDAIWDGSDDSCVGPDTVTTGKPFETVYCLSAVVTTHAVSNGALSASHAQCVRASQRLRSIYSGAALPVFAATLT